MGILKAITDAQIATAVVYPTTPYKGTLPTKTVKIGSKGTSVVAVQRFLNWCIKANLKVDGICGNKTSAAIRRFQKQQKLKVDGIFGEKTRARALAIVKKYEVEPLKPTPAPTPTPKTWVDNANAWAKKIASDNSYHYVKWKGNDKKTQKCCVCHGYEGADKGFNCIRYAISCWFHGGGLPVAHEGGLIHNSLGNRMYKASLADATKMAQNALKCKDIKVIRNKKGIPKSEWKAGDLCMMFSGTKYVHMFYYMGGGKIADAIGSNGKVPNDKQIAVRDYKKYSAKIIIRYIGK